MTNGLRPKVEQDLFHLYDFTIRKKNALKKFWDQYPIFCVAKFTTQKCCPGSTICKLLSSIYICLMLFATWRHILFVYSATACLFLPTNFRSCQRLIAMTPKYFFMDITLLSIPVKHRSKHIDQVILKTFNRLLPQQMQLNKLPRNHA